MAIVDLFSKEKLTVSSPNVEVTPVEVPNEDIFANNKTSNLSANNAINPINMDYATDEEIDAWYKEWLSDKQSYGIKTTKMRNDNEVNFAEYGAALSDELQEELLSYFEEGAINKEEALEAQQKIAALYTSRNEMSFEEFSAAVKSLGYEISRESVHTSYIIDDKKSKADHGGEYTTGNISVFSIKNKDGETLFKIADTNGNAAIEVEEVFMNELLSGISNQIDTDKFKSMVADGSAIHFEHSASSTQLALLNNENENINKTDEETKAKDGKHIITQVQYDKLTNEKIELLIRNGYEESEAKSEAKKFMDKNYTVDNSSSNKAVKVAGFYTSTKHINNSNDKKLDDKEIISEENKEEILEEEEELIA